MKMKNNISQIDYTGKKVTVSIRGMDTGAWAYALYLAKREGLKMPEFITALLEEYESDTSDE